MIELIVLLGKFIHIIGNQSGAERTSCFSHNCGIIGQTLYESNLAFTGSHSYKLTDSEALIGSLAKHRTDTSMGVLDERTGIAIEVDRFLGIEGHVLARIHLEKEIFQSTQSYHFGNILHFRVGASVKLTAFRAYGTRSADHFIHEIIGIHNRTLAALHLAIRKLYHTIGEVDKILTPTETEAIKQQ